MFLSYLFSGMLLFVTVQSAAPISYTTAEAKAQVGEWIKVCGTLSEVREPFRRSGPTYLNFDASYPKTYLPPPSGSGIGPALVTSVCIGDKASA